MVSSEQVIPREQRPAIANYLSQRLAGPVAMETWTQRESALVRTDRDPCIFCEPVSSAARQLAALHPLISITPYDIDTHADRAAEAGIERPPVTVLRGRNGREVRFVGLWSGLLFSSFMDALVYVGAGVAPIQPETREALHEIEDEVRLELLIAPYDPYSAYTLRVASAFAVEGRRIRLEAIEVSEFPRLAQARMVTELPLLVVNGRRFTGAWDEPDLLEQLKRVVEGNDEPVVRERILVSPYMDIEQAQAYVAREMQGEATSGQPPTTPGGLIIPGR